MSLLVPVRSSRVLLFEHRLELLEALCLLPASDRAGVIDLPTYRQVGDVQQAGFVTEQVEVVAVQQVLE